MKASQPLLLMLVLTWAALAGAEICSLPLRPGGTLQAPCYNGTQQAPIYGPWLSPCAGDYSTRLSSQLAGYVQTRVQELYSGADQGWDAQPQTPPTSSFSVAPCDLAASTPETTTNHLGKSCGTDLVPTDLSTPGSWIIQLKAPSANWAEKSYRYGAWIQALEYFQLQVTGEVVSTGGLEISSACQGIASNVLSQWTAMGPVTFQLQPNIAAISDGSDPCPENSSDPSMDPYIEELLYLQSYSGSPDLTTPHIDPLTTRNRMSGCLMISARTRIESSFLQVAACEVRARAAAVDREYFIPGSACAASLTPSLSLWEQEVQYRVLRGSCETAARNSCTTGSPAACKSGAGFSLSDPGCWPCIFGKIQSCYASSMPQLLTGSSPRLPPAGTSITASTTLPDPTTYPENLAGLTIPNVVGLGINYKIDRDGCMDPSQNIAGCPNAHTDMMLSGVGSALDGLNETLLQAAGQESPLQSSFEMDSNQDEPVDRGTELPQDGVEAPLYFGTSVLPTPAPTPFP